MVFFSISGGAVDLEITKSTANDIALLNLCRRSSLGVLLGGPLGLAKHWSTMSVLVGVLHLGLSPNLLALLSQKMAVMLPQRFFGSLQEVARQSHVFEL